jgi:endonuclease V-like protein UPF0215 family
MKREIRILGIDDGHFLKHSKGNVLVIGAILRGRELDGLLSCYIEKDGLDATHVLAGLIRQSKYLKQLKAIMTNGVTLAGFNILDITELNRRTGVPAISIIRKKPNQKKIENALENFLDKRKRLSLLAKAGKIYNHKSIYFQAAGITGNRARELIDQTTVRSNVPEPVRVAHIIASGVSYGKSTKRA